MTGKKSKEQEILEIILENLPINIKVEYLPRFKDEKNYRGDYAIPEKNLLIEFEGGIFMNHSGHRSISGFLKDVDKYNVFSKNGWRIFRVTKQEVNDPYKLEKDLKMFIGLE